MSSAATERLEAQGARAAVQVEDVRTDDRGAHHIEQGLADQRPVGRVIRPFGTESRRPRKRPEVMIGLCEWAMGCGSRGDRYVARYYSLSSSFPCARVPMALTPDPPSPLLSGSHTVREASERRARLRRV